jgi:hypothetical protein
MTELSSTKFRMENIQIVHECIQDVQSPLIPLLLVYFWPQKKDEIGYFHVEGLKRIIVLIVIE